MVKNCNTVKVAVFACFAKLCRLSSSIISSLRLHSAVQLSVKFRIAGIGPQVKDSFCPKKGGLKGKDVGPLKNGKKGETFIIMSCKHDV